MTENKTAGYVKKLNKSIALDGANMKAPSDETFHTNFKDGLYLKPPSESTATIKPKPKPKPKSESDDSIAKPASKP